MTKQFDFSPKGKIMLKNKLITYLRWFCLVGLTLTSCVTLSKTGVTQASYPTPTIDLTLVDRSWLTGDPCAAPCWYGIEVGKSSKDQTLKITGDLRFLDPRNTEVNNYQSRTGGDIESISYGCKDDLGHACLVMNFENDMLSKLLLIPNYPVSFEEVIDRIGLPDMFSYQPQTADAGGCNVALVWINDRMMLMHTQDFNSPESDLCVQIYQAHKKIPKGLQVETVFFLQEGDMQTMILNNNFQKWEGFTN